MRAWIKVHRSAGSKVFGVTIWEGWTTMGGYYCIYKELELETCTEKLTLSTGELFLIGEISGTRQQETIGAVAAIE
jgi:hypothetical protein